MINRISNIVRSLGGLVVLAIIIAIFGTILRISNTSPSFDGYPISRSLPQSSQPTPYPGPSSEILPAKEETQIGSFPLVSPVTSIGIEAETTAGNYAAWVESLSSGGNFSTQLVVFDLTRRTQFVIAKGSPRNPDIKDDILTWQEYSENRWIIYGYDFTSSKKFIVTEGSDKHLFPHVCSREWLIYLRNVEEGRPGSADLYAHNLISSQNVLIGQVPFPNNTVPGRHHACDGNLVTWIDIVADNVGFQQHLYDLENNTDEIINDTIRGLSFDVTMPN